MRYMLALMVLVLGLEGVDRALLERAMDEMKPPRVPLAMRALAQGKLQREPRLYPPPPPPPPKEMPGDAQQFP